MKNLFILTVLGLTLFACGSGAEKENELSVDLIENPNTAAEDGSSVDQSELPHFEFVEKVKDFGQITQGEIVSTSFRFKNVGQSDLLISSAQGSCGCTVPEWPKEPIKPGEEGVIDVTFDSNGKKGMQNKTITLVANTVPNTMVLALKGEVLAPEK